MLPELRALFDLPRRFLPGLGARVHGYADKRGVEGIQATGANGVFTLGRSETSGTIPSLGTATQPAQLRAGPGVRIHGYGGIHTLERLSLPVEETPLVGTARLEWEVEKSWGGAYLCALSGDEENWITAVESTYNYEGGSFIDTVTASGVTTTHGPDDPTPDECDALVYTYGADPEVEYGGLISIDDVYTTVSRASLGATAIGALAFWETIEGAQSWNESEWGTQIFDAVFGTASCFDYYEGFGGARADSLRFRLTNAGTLPLSITCGFYGSGVSGGVSDVETTLELGRGETSAWQNAPSITYGDVAYRTAEIRRVRIGRWRFIT